jgi:hypothetical protein
MRILPVLAALLASAAMALADARTVEFAGQHYTLNFADQATLPDGQPGEGLAEFTLPGETVDDWSKLFAFHAYPEMDVDPLTAVELVGKAVKETNKDANYAVVSNDETGEAIIDFLTWAPESDIMEFNVFKYARAADGRGLVAMQYAQHIKLGDIDVDGMRALRARMVDDMAATNISQAQAYFAGKQAVAPEAGEHDEATLAPAGRSD